MCSLGAWGPYNCYINRMKSSNVIKYRDNTDVRELYNDQFNSYTTTS